MSNTDMALTIYQSLYQMGQIDFIVPNRVLSFILTILFIVSMSQIKKQRQEEMK